MRAKICSTAEQAQLSGIVEAEHDADNSDKSMQSCMIIIAMAAAGLACYGPLRYSSGDTPLIDFFNW